jgi:opacity protein-like surface antigen
MKKLLLAAVASSAILSSTAFAVEENTFYLKLNAGANKMNRIKEGKVKLKSKMTPVLEFGPGYYIMDNFRTDFTFYSVFNPEQKLTLKENNQTANVKSKANIMALMINGYVDLFDVSVAKIFAGAGVGVARVKEKLSRSVKDANDKNIATDSISGKNKTNFSYQLTIGGSTEIAPGVNAELAYKWMDYGKSKLKDVKGHKFKGHHVLAGVRFDL